MRNFRHSIRLPLLLLITRSLLMITSLRSKTLFLHLSFSPFLCFYLFLFELFAILITSFLSEMFFASCNWWLDRYKDKHNNRRLRIADCLSPSTLTMTFKFSIYFIEIAFHFILYTIHYYSYYCRYITISAGCDVVADFLLSFTIFIILHYFICLLFPPNSLLPLRLFLHLEIIVFFFATQVWCHWFFFLLFNDIILKWINFSISLLFPLSPYFLYYFFLI